jgi:predicted  nucleic acid-binding Zn-ribbon protein
VPSRTLEDKVEELLKLTTVLREQVATAQEDIKDVGTEQANLNQEVANLKTRMALLEGQAMEWGHIKEEVATLRDLKIPIALLDRSVKS